MENKIFSALREWGCDVDGAMERMLYDEGFYLSMLRETLALSEVEKLGEALEKDDKEQAFLAAHDLKGVLGNVGLTPMYKLDCEIVEVLRAKADGDLLAKQRELAAMRDKLKAIMEAGE